MATKDLKPVFPIYKGHIACICAHSIALNIVIYPGTGMPFNRRRPVWVLTGTGKTNRNGSDYINVNSYLINPLCNSESSLYDLEPVIIDSQPIVLVTPISKNPVVLSTESTINKIESFMFRDVLDGSRIEHQRNEYGVGFKIFSWNLNGEHAPNIDFSWICIAEAALRVEPPV